MTRIPRLIALAAVAGLLLLPACMEPTDSARAGEGEGEGAAEGEGEGSAEGEGEGSAEGEGEGPGEGEGEGPAEGEGEGPGEGEGEGEGGLCPEICDKIVECARVGQDPPGRPRDGRFDCMMGCEASLQSLADEDAALVAACVAETECEELPADAENLGLHCLGQLDCLGQPSPLDGIFCGALDECGFADADECLAGELPPAFGCASGEAIAAAADCLERAGCEGLHACFPDGDRPGVVPPPECAAACEKIVSCGAETFGECMNGCSGARAAFSDEAFEALGVCIAATPCEAVEEAGGTARDLGDWCMQRLECIDPEAEPVRALALARCEAEARCRGTDPDECAAWVEENDLGEAAVFACIDGWIVDGMVECLAEVECGALDRCTNIFGEEPPDPCAEYCEAASRCGGGGDDHGLAGCLVSCRSLVDVLRPGAFEAFSRCMAETTCDALPVREDGRRQNLGEYCLVGLDCVGGPSPLGPLYCETRGGCEDGFDVAACRRNPNPFFGCIREEAVEAARRCVEHAGCDSLQACFPFVEGGGLPPTPECERVCEHLAGCGHQSYADCLRGCSGASAVFAPGAFEQYAGCMSELPCEALPPDGGDAGGLCVQEMDCIRADNPALRGVLDARCAALVRCGVVELEACARPPDMRELGELVVLGCLSEPLLGRVHGCLAEAECGELDRCFQIFGDDGPNVNCADVCEASQRCRDGEPAGMDQCVQRCEALLPRFDQETVDQITGCIHELPCDDLAGDDGGAELGEYCLARADCWVAESDLAPAWCARLVACDPGMTLQACLADHVPPVLGCLRGPAAEEAGACLQHAACGRLATCVPYAIEPPLPIPEECPAACEKVAECGGESMDECLGGCSEAGLVFAADAWEEIGACIAETPCDAVDPADDGSRDLGEYCIGRLECVDPAAESVGAVWRALCLAQVRCGDRPAGSCLHVEVPPEVGMLACLRDAVLAEVMGCLAAAECGRVGACLEVLPGGDEGEAPDPAR